MNEKEKYLKIYGAPQHETSQRDVIPGHMGGGYGRICWGENMLETLKAWNITSLLDVGCGYGNFCDAAALFVPRVYGLDIASVAAGEVIDNPEITYLDGEAKDLPLPDKAVEWITSFDCLEHCLEADVDEILKEFDRVASKGFVLSISYEPCEMNGMPLHMTVKPESWWIGKLSKYGAVSKEGQAPITGAPYLICRKPVEKTLVCYCAGSIGTRLKGIALADRVARQTGRRLNLVWLDNDPLCRIPFSSLFTDPVPLMFEEEMLDLPSCKIYAHIKEVADQALISGGKVLRKAVRKWGSSEADTLSSDDVEDNIIIYAPGSKILSVNDAGKDLIGNLSPTIPIRERIREFTERLTINKKIMGVHARGTDFGIHADAYAQQIQKAVSRNPNQKFLVCSDDRTYEQTLKEHFPEHVIVRPKSAWMEKKDASLPWALGNVDTSEASVTEALIDLYLLANTQFAIYHESSAFAQVGSLLSQKNDLGPAEQGARAPRTYNAHCQSVQHNNRNCPYETTLKTANSGATGNDPGTQTQHTIYYVCPDVDIQSAGIRRLYRHVGILATAGFKSCILHLKAGFRRNDLPDVPIRYLEQQAFEPNDIIVIPEGCPTIMKALKDYPVRRFVIALNGDYVFRNLEQGTDWRAFKIERVISVSKPIAEMVSWSMGLPTHVLESSINHQLYYFDKTGKQPHVVYIARKGAHAEYLKRLLGARNPYFVKNFKWIGLNGLNEERYAEQVRQAAVFLNLSMAEGYPTSCLEAMASGTLVASYISMGDKALLRGEGPGKNCLLAPIGDYASLAFALEPFLTALRHGHMKQWNKLLSNGLKTISGLTAETESQSLISFWRNICFNQSTWQQVEVHSRRI